MSAHNALILYRFCAKDTSSLPFKILQHFVGRLTAFTKAGNIPARFVLIADNTPRTVTREVEQLLVNFDLDITHTGTLDGNGRTMPNGTVTSKWQPKHFTHFVTSMQKAQQYAGDDTVIFFCEDDYLYHDTALFKAFQMALKYKGDFVSLYDGPSHYGPHLSVQALRADRPGYDLEMVREFDHHWKTGDSACFTYVATMEALKRQGNFFLGMEGDWGDCGLWKGMWQNRKSKLWTSVPALVYHNNSLNFDNEYWSGLMAEVRG
jgi:hypothetical protein